MLHVKQPDMVSGVPLHLKQNPCQYMNWQFINIMYKKIDVLERPTSACHLISWAIFYQYNTIHVVKFPDFSLTCGNDVLTERKVLLAHTLQLKRGSQNRDFQKEFVEARCY